LAADFNTTGALTTFMTTAALGVGTWDVAMGGMYTETGSGFGMEGQTVVGTATAVLLGSTSFGVAGAAGTLVFGFGCAFRAVVTVAGTLVFQAVDTGGAGTIKAASVVNLFGQATGWSASRVA
jgi:hypothetical protein